MMRCIRVLATFPCRGGRYQEGVVGSVVKNRSPEREKLREWRYGSIILDVITKLRCAVSLTARPFYPLGNRPSSKGHVYLKWYTAVDCSWLAQKSVSVYIHSVYLLILTLCGTSIIKW